MAFSFNGSNQYLEIGAAVVTGYPFTLAAIIKRGNATSATALSLDVSGTSRTFMALYLDAAGNGRAGIEAPTVNAYPTPSFAHSIGETVFLAGTFTSSFVAQYSNGVYRAGLSHSIGFSSVINRTRIGAIRWDGSFYDYADDLIAEPAIWNVALTDAEIASLAAGFTPDQIRPQSLQFYAPLVRGLIDVRGGQTITNVNSATVATHPRIIT